LKVVYQHKIILYNSLQVDTLWVASKIVCMPLRNLCWTYDNHQQLKTLETGSYFCTS